MADREAKIKFKAETEEFQAGIKAANSELSSLRSEMKLNEAQFQNNGDKVEYLEQKQALLEAQLEANRDKQTALNAEIEVATSIYGEDSQEVSNLERQLNYAMTQEEQLESQLASTTSELEASQSATGQLTSTISEQEAELAALKDEYASAVLTYGENSEQAQELGARIEELSGSLVENRQSVEEAREAADRLDASMGTAGESVVGASDTMSDALANAGVAGALAEIGQAAYEMASEFDDASATIVEGTGASGDALSELEDAAVQSFGNMKNASGDLGDVAGVVAELNTRLGVTGDEASGLADDVIAFAHHVGTDAVGSVDSIVDVMHRWGLENSDIGGLLDDLTTSNQACALSVDEMTGYLTRNSTQFQELGFSMEDSLAFMISLSDGGANTGQVMSSLTKAVSNLSSVTDDVPGAFGQAIDAIAGCDTVSAALQAQVGDTGKTVEDVFGKRAAQEIAACVQNGNMDLERFSAMLRDNQGAMQATADNATTMGDEMSRVTNNVAVVFDSIFAPALSGIIGAIADVVGGFGQLVRDSPALQAALVAVATVLGVLATALAITSLIQAVTKAFSLLNLEFLKNPIFLVVTAIAALVAAIVYLWNNCEEFRNAVMAIWDGIMGAISPVIEWFTSYALPAIQGFIDIVAGLFSGLGEVIGSFAGASGEILGTWLSVLGENWSVAWNAIGEVVSIVWGAIQGVVETVSASVGDVIATWLEAVLALWGPAWDNILAVVDSVWNLIWTVVSTVANVIWTVIKAVMAAISGDWSAAWNAVWELAGNIWNGIKNTIGAAINVVATVISSVIDGISQTWSTVWNAVWNTARTIWDGIRSAIEVPLRAAGDAVSTVVNAVASGVSNAFNGILSTATSVWNGVRSAIETPINAARDLVGSAIDAIKGFFNFSIQWPHIPLPHFGINPPGWQIGDLLKGSIPSLAIDWYANGAVLTRPTIFGASGGRLMGGGEAGAEAVLPVETLQGMIDAAFQRNLGGTAGEVAGVRRAIERLDAGLGRKIADNAPDSWPGDRSFRTALRKAGAIA